MLEDIRQLCLTLRDLLIPILPKSIVRKLIGKGEFVFLAHPLDLLPDIARKYPIAKRLPKWVLKIISRHHPPIILGKIKGFRKKDGSLSEGWIVFCSMSTRMMVLKQEIARRKILAAAKFSEKLGAKILGLGAFIPIITDDGRLLSGKTRMFITNGAAFSAIIAVKNIIEAARLAKKDFKTSKLAVVGAAGSVGSVCVKMLLNHFNNLLLVDKNLEGLERLKSELDYNAEIKKVAISDEINEIGLADVILVVTNTPGAIVRAAHLKKGAIVVDAAQPRNVSVKVPQERKDVIVIESGIAEVKDIYVDCNIGLLKRNEVYSCLAESMILSWAGLYEDYVGEVKHAHAVKLNEIAEHAGVKLADFRNYLGPLDASHFTNIFRANG